MTPLRKYDTFGKRLVAGIIDGIVFLPFTVLSNRLEHAADKTLFLVLTFSYTICWMLYVVIGHGRYGQTIGKRLMNIKVLDLMEQDVIGYKSAFIREGVWFFVQTLGLVYFIFTAYNTTTPAKDLNDTFFDGYVGTTITAWFVLELVTMVLNKKRRAVHDYLAGSVVIDVNEMKREDLHRRHAQLLSSMQSK